MSKVTLRRDELVAEARKYVEEHPGWHELGDTPDMMADFAMMIAARVAVRMTPPPGHVVVPKKPTEAMLSALQSYAQCSGYIEEGYRAMIAEATRKENGE